MVMPVGSEVLDLKSPSLVFAYCEFDYQSVFAFSSDWI